MRTPRDLTGQKFGSLKAIRAMFHRNGYWQWLVKCECGAVKTVRGTYLTTGYVTSCGDRTAHPRKKGALNSYTAVHNAMRRIKGSASDHTCKCGEQAQQWAHKGCEHETLGARGTGAYCSEADPECYSALCLDCHRFYDAMNRKFAHVLGRA